MSMEIKDPTLAEQVAAWRKQHKCNGVERRLTPGEVRIAVENKVAHISGYAAVFNQRTQLWRHYYEQVVPGAFANSIQADDVRALINHDPNRLLGRTKAGTLMLSEDAYGLRYEIISPDTTYARDLEVSLKRQDISQSSFGFSIVKHRESRDEKTGDMTVILQEVRLFDVSPVTFPAYPGTEAHVRMIVGENESACVYEDSGEVIVMPTEARIEADKQSAKEFFASIDELKARLSL